MTLFFRLATPISWYVDRIAVIASWFLQQARGVQVKVKLSRVSSDSRNATLSRAAAMEFESFGEPKLLGGVLLYQTVPVSTLFYAFHVTPATSVSRRASSLLFFFFFFFVDFIRSLIATSFNPRTRLELSSSWKTLGNRGISSVASNKFSEKY